MNSPAERIATEQALPHPSLEEVRAANNFPEVVDNTMRSTAVRCGKQWYWSSIRKLRPQGGSIHLHAGGVFAKAIETGRKAHYEHGKPAKDSIADALRAAYDAWGTFEVPEGKENKSLENIALALDGYYSEYPFDRDPVKPYIDPTGKPAVEFCGTFPLDIKHPQTGNPVLYAFRFDMLGEYNGNLFVVDEKTASSLGAQWANNWTLDSQFTGYCAGARTFGYPVAGAIIRGIGLLKTKITHQQCIIYRPDWVIDRWLEQLHRDVRRMIEQWQEGYYNYAIDKSACAAYGGCAFMRLCDSPNPESWVEQYYEYNDWDPLKKL
jgi:hypothetical protein